MPELHINNPDHYADFIRLNEQWIAQYFTIEESDRRLAAKPGAVIDRGGYILSLTEHGQVIGVCALFKQDSGVYELARLAVAESQRGRGHGDHLLREALSIMQGIGAQQVNLMSNTKLGTALSLYKKHGFRILSEGPHPVYKRSNITMQKDLHGNKDV